MGGEGKVKSRKRKRGEGKGERASQNLGPALYRNVYYV